MSGRTFDVRKAFPPADGSVPPDMVPVSGLPYRSRPVGPDHVLRREGEGLRSHLMREPVQPVVPFSLGEAEAPRDRAPPSDAVLRDRLAAQARRIIGSAEHVQVASLISAARSLRLDAQATEALALTVQHATHTVERNLDLVRVPPEGLWVEWPESARYRTTPREGAAHPVVTGALVVPWPEDPEALTVLTGWLTADGAARHSYATAVVHLGHLKALAWDARNAQTDHGDAASLERLGRAYTVTIPPGLGQELDFLVGVEVEHGGARDADAVRRDAAAQAYLDVAPDVPFVLAALLLAASASSEVVPADAIDALTLRPVRDTLGERWRAFRGLPRHEGFLRRGYNDQASARLVPPRGAVPAGVVPRAAPAAAVTPVPAGTTA